MSKLDVVACIPAYNEEKYIAAILLKTKQYVDKIIVYDDGSSDMTGDIAEALGAITLKNRENLGYGNALKSLYKKALEMNVDIIVTLDADGQHDPENIPLLVDTLINNNLDIVIGSRFIGKQNTVIPLWRKTGIEIINNLTNSALTDTQSGFRVFKRESLEKITLIENGMGVSTEILIKAKNLDLKIGEAPINIKYFDDSSTHDPISHGLQVVYTTLKHISIGKPLLFFGIPGGIGFFISTIFWTITIRNYSITHTLSTNLSLISIFSTIIGFILITTSFILWSMKIIIDNKIK